MNDLKLRTKLWQEEETLVVCPLHIIGFKGIDEVKKIRKRVECGFHDCPEDGAYEVVLQGNA